MNTIKENHILLRRDQETGIECVRGSFSGHAYDLHDHDEVLVGVTISGVQQFNSRRILHTSTQGCTMLFEPGTSHDGYAPPGHKFTYIMLSLPQMWIDGMLESRESGSFAKLGTTFRRPLVQSLPLSAAVTTAFRGLQGREGRLARDLGLDNLIDALGLHLRSARKDQYSECPASLKRVKDYLNEYVNTDISLNELAAISGLDRFRLTRQFNQHFGLSPHAYLVRLRLRRAKTLLAKGVKPANVAVSVGFSDQSHLGRWFKRAYRLSPAAYQRSCTDVLYS